MGVDSNYSLPDAFERHESLQDQSSGFMDPFASSTEQTTDNFDSLFDFDTSSSGIDYGLPNPTSQLVDFGAAPFACDGSAFFG